VHDHAQLLVGFEFGVAVPLARRLCTSRISPVAGDCVVELVGLEPTTKVLWNMV